MAVLSITALYNFFQDEHKSISRGENHFKSGHVQSFNFEQGILRGQILASMKKKHYNVTVSLVFEMMLRFVLLTIQITGNLC